MNLSKNARSAKAWFRRRDAQLTRFARFLDRMAVVRAVRQRLRWVKR